MTLSGMSSRLVKAVNEIVPQLPLTRKLLTSGELGVSYTLMGFELFQEIHLPRIQWGLEQPEQPFTAAFAF